MMFTDIVHSKFQLLTLITTISVEAALVVNWEV